MRQQRNYRKSVINLKGFNNENEDDGEEDNIAKTIANFHKKMQAKKEQMQNSNSSSSDSNSNTSSDDSSFSSSMSSLSDDAP